MNIFVTSSCPTEAAKVLDDKRVVKMVLETAQMLSTAINESGGKAPYRSTHVNHPCNVWARTSQANFMWLWEHGKALAAEYVARYGKTHKSEPILDEILDGVSWIDPGELTPFANCARNKDLGLDFTDITDIHLAYTTYLSHRWDLDKREPTWYGFKGERA